MSKSYKKKSDRSRRKSSPLEGQVAEYNEKKGEVSLQLVLPVAEILAGLNASVEALAGEAGLLIMKTLIDDEVDKIAGEKNEQDRDRTAFRWGHEDGYVIFNGKKAPFRRPRVREVNGKEVQLKRYDLFQSDERMQRSAAGKVLCGVSMRDYEKSLDAFCEGYGIEKSSVSRHWKAASAKKLKEMMERPLSALNMAALMIDGVEFHEYLHVVALGIDPSGRKHVLGLWQGATENAEVCKTLFDHLVERGLRTDRSCLLVLDGSKALKKAVKAHFGEGVFIQRCQIHKEKNVLEHLPERYHAVVRLKLRAAWSLNEYAQAKQELAKVVEYLRGISEPAARSLEEAFEETLTIHRLGVTGLLRMSLRSTNPIESCFSSMKELCRNVKHWKNSNMALRWSGTMLLEAEKRFRRVKGYRHIPALIAALNHSVEEKREVA